MNRICYIDDFNQIRFQKTDQLIMIDGKKCEKAEDFYKIIYALLGFPYESNYSLDTFNDWMTDCHFFYSDSIKIIIINNDFFLKKDIQFKEKIKKLFEESILPYWEKNVEKICLGGKVKMFNIFVLNN